MFRFFLFAALFSAGIIVPNQVQAHGELLIRIAAVTREMDAATNGLAQLYLKRGELHREHLDWEAAESDYAQAEQLDSELPGLQYCRARMLDDSGQWDASLALFDKILAELKNDGEAFVGRARVKAKLKQTEAAIADFELGVRLAADPKAEYYMEWAQALASNTQVESAIIRLDEGIQRFGPIVMLQSYALDLEVERKNYDMAIRRLDTIVEQVFRKEDWFVRRGIILTAAGSSREARLAFGAALDAIATLPSRIQQGPAMTELKARIGILLAGLEEPPSLGRAD